MTAHSMEGYLSALTIREHPTLLVEGKNDKKTIDRLYSFVCSVEPGDAGPLVVDSTEVIKEPGGHGARQIVEMAYARAAAEGLSLGALVDREYREFDLRPDLVDRLVGHHTEAAALFWTRGHSIENYFFVEHAVLAFLTLQFSHVVNAASRAALSSTLPSVLTWCCAISLAARELAVIGRCEGLVGPDHWFGNPPTLSFDVSALTAGLQSRGASVDAEKFDRLVQEYLAIAGRVDGPTIRWAIHGNIGQDMLWAGVARIIQPWCRGAEDHEQIGSGHNDLKVRVSAQEWVERVESGDEEEPAALIAWLRSQREAA